tara:strand:- start:855 stop:1745 length:891 start_codon:yes stop_codon:yes gene_type:complete
MEFTEEFITSNGLSAEQVAAVTGHFTSEVIPGLKQEYDGVANTNAEGILTGAGSYAKEKLGIDFERNQGEKIGDYLKRGLDAKFSSTESTLALKQTEIDEKLANFKGGDEYKAQLDTLKGDKDLLLQRIAKLEPLEGMDEKYQGATTELGKLKREVGYSTVKPNFPKEVNTFEADSKWKSFIFNTEENYNIELIDGKPFAIDKQNIHKRFELQTLVDQDENIKELLKGRQQGGTGASAAEMNTVEGIPFQIPTNATKEHISKLVGNQVEKEFGERYSRKAGDRFAQIWALIKNAKK